MGGVVQERTAEVGYRECVSGCMRNARGGEGQQKAPDMNMLLPVTMGVRLCRESKQGCPPGSKQFFSVLIRTPLEAACPQIGAPGNQGRSQGVRVLCFFYCL